VVALHFLSPGVQSAQAFVVERQTAQVWVLCEQVPWLLQVPASWSCVEAETGREATRGRGARRHAIWA
jgi:hypothetical protein